MEKRLAALGLAVAEELELDRHADDDLRVGRIMRHADARRQRRRDPVAEFIGIADQHLADLNVGAGLGDMVDRRLEEGLVVVAEAEGGLPVDAEAGAEEAWIASPGSTVAAPPTSGELTLRPKVWR